MKKNSLLENGVVPGSMKCAKVILEKVIPRSWCSFKLSNLPFLSKVLERTVASQLHDLNGLYSKMQSAYCWRYSTETKLLCAYNDLLWALDEGSEALLVLLDLSSAFNTVNHYISLTRLGIASPSLVLCWNGLDRILPRVLLLFVLELFALLSLPCVTRFRTDSCSALYSSHCMFHLLKIS